MLGQGSGTSCHACSMWDGIPMTARPWHRVFNVIISPRCYELISHGTGLSRRLGLLAIQEMVATLPIARWMEQCSAAAILLSVRVGRMQEMTKNPLVDGTHGQTNLSGVGSQDCLRRMQATGPLHHQLQYACNDIVSQEICQGFDDTLYSWQDQGGIAPTLERNLG